MAIIDLTRNAQLFDRIDALLHTKLSHDEITEQLYAEGFSLHDIDAEFEPTQ